MSIMDGYAVTITAQTRGDTGAEFDDVAQLVDTLEAHGAAVSCDDAGQRWSTTMSIENVDDIQTAVAEALRVLHHASSHLPAWEPAGVHAVTYAEQDLELAHPLWPDLLGTAELAEILGVSRTRVGQLRRDHPLWPAPIAELASGPIYTRPSITRFLDEWDRSPGRRAAPAHQ